MQHDRPPENKLKSPFYKMVIRCLNMQVYATTIALVPFVGFNSFMSAEWAAFLTSLIGLLLYYLLLYTVNWATAERDRNLVLYQHIREEKARGLRAGAYAAVPLFVMTLLALIQLWTGALGDVYMVVYRLIFLPFIFFINLAQNNPGPGAVLLLLTCALCPFSSWLGYRNGYKLLRLMDRIVYKQKPRAKDKRLR